MTQILVHVHGYNGKSGTVPRAVWVYFLFWGRTRVLLTLQKKPQKAFVLVPGKKYPKIEVRDATLGNSHQNCLLLPMSTGPQEMFTSKISLKYR